MDETFEMCARFAHRGCECVGHVGVDLVLRGTVDESIKDVDEPLGCRYGDA